MANNEIIAEFEELDRIVKDFADGIGSFLDRMNDNSAEINTAMSVLFSSWTGTLADDFKRNIEKQLAVIASSTQRAESLREQLNATSLEMAQALATLRDGGNVE